MTAPSPPRADPVDVAAPAQLRAPGRVGGRTQVGAGLSRLAVVVLVAVLAVPYLVRGPGFLADDFVWLRNARFGGWAAASGSRLISRPLSELLTDLTFGGIGPHPVPLYLIQVGLWMVAGVAVLGCLRRFVSPNVALAVTLVWLWLPNHASLEHWLSTPQAWLAVALLALGVSRLAEAARRDRFSLLGPLLLAASICSYELGSVLAVAAVVVVPWLARRRWDRRNLLVGLAACGGAIAWSLAWASEYPRNTSLKVSLGSVPGGLFSLGFEPSSTSGHLATWAVLLVVVGSALLLAARHLVPGARHLGSGVRAPARLAVAGAIVALVGVVPQLPVNTSFYGSHDRSNTFTAVGAALVVAAGGWLVLCVLRRLVAGSRRPGALRRGVPPAVVVVLVTALVAFGGAMRVSWNRDYAEAQHRVARTVDQLAARHVRAGAVLHARPVATGAINSLRDGWNASAAVQFRKDDATAVVWVVNGCTVTGPPPDRPLVTWGTVRERWKLADCHR